VHHEHFTPIDEGNPYLLRKASQAFGDQVSDRCAGLCEAARLVSLVVIKWQQTTRIDRSKGYVREPPSADRPELLQPLPNRKRLVASEQEVARDVNALDLQSIELAQNRFEGREIPV
jgi:hypothetical protein